MLLKTNINETKENRLKRFKDNPPNEIIDTLLNSIANSLNIEISLAIKKKQSSLLFLGIHASILTISDTFFDMKPKDAYTKFLTLFMDKNDIYSKYSLIANIIHDWRNILAHQWISSLGHKLGYDYTMSQGWNYVNEQLIINPEIYGSQYLETFAMSGKIWDYENILKSETLNSIKDRMITKFITP